MTIPSARVLVVDDEKLIRWSVSERLQRSGYEVLSAESGEQALELLAASPPTSCCSTCGCRASTESRRCSARSPQNADLIVLMMSAHSTVDIAVEAMKHGATDFLVKPFPFQALDAAVERAIATARTRRQIATLASERRNGTALDAIVGGLGRDGAGPLDDRAARGARTRPRSSSRARAAAARRSSAAPSTSRARARSARSCR